MLDGVVNISIIRAVVMVIPDANYLSVGHLSKVSIPRVIVALVVSMLNKIERHVVSETEK